VTLGHPGMAKGPTANHSMSLLPDDAAYRSGDVQGRYVGEEAQSDDYVATIKAWLKTCLSHSRCCQTISGLRQINTEQALLPTRCIDVLGKGLQLKETGSQTGSYIALSHRWTEESELCCTTTGNIDARRQGAVNDLQLLPKTFCHILDLARRLGVRYVWIDSLCIIQHGDDGHDWRQECVKMADYYQQSLLTVMATSGSREHGLFPPKANPPPTIARLPYRDRNGVRQGYFYVYSYDEAVGQQYHTFVQESELLSRGWVFQEWLLSRRIVCFTPSGMFMECETVRPRNERGETIQAWSWDDSPAGNQPLAKASFIFGTAPTTSQWYKIVESYSALSLTQPDKDRIVALAGIASEFRDALRGAASGGKFPPRTVPCGLEFASGLWVHDLHRGLLWAQKLPGCAPRRVNRSPTWSWASVSCPVIWDEHSTALDPKAEVVAVIVPGGNALSIASLPQTAPRSALPPARAFDVDNSFAYLRMTGKVQRVIVREMFSQEEELRVACDMLGHASESAKSLWRKACSNVQPMEITGWASIEHPDFQNESLFERGLEVSAFLISTTSKSPGYGLGFLTYYNIYNVIFIMNVGGQRYERLGVGRLFGKEIGDGFRMADAKHIELC